MFSAIADFYAKYFLGSNYLRAYTHVRCIFQYDVPSNRTVSNLAPEQYTVDIVVSRRGLDLRLRIILIQT